MADEKYLDHKGATPSILQITCRKLFSFIVTKKSIPYVSHLLLVPVLDKFHFFLGIIGLDMHICKVWIFRKFHFSITYARLSKAEIFYPTGGRDRLPFGQSLLC